MNAPWTAPGFGQRVISALRRAPQRMAIAVIRVYQWTISPLLGPRCRFEPSCSRYACACLEQHGLLRGTALTARRLSRCHPFHPGGYDPPPSIPGGHHAPPFRPEHDALASALDGRAARAAVAAGEAAIGDAP